MTGDGRRVGDESRLPYRIEWPFVAVLIAGGAVLRVLALHAGFWRDEGSTYFDIVQQFPIGVIETVRRTELSPPGFFLLMALWARLFGTGEIALKLPALICGLGLIPAAYVLGLQVARSQATARVAALIAATAPAAIYYSQDARSYSLAALLCCLAAIAYVRLVESRDRLGWFGFVGLSVALAYVQYAGLVFVIAALAATIYAFVIRKPSDSPWTYALAFATIGLLVLPLGPSIAFALHVGNPWQPAGGSSFAHALLANLLAAVPFAIPTWSGRVVAIAAGVLALALGLEGYGAWRGRKSPAALLRQPLALLVVIYVVAAAIEAKQGARVMFAFEPIGWTCLGFWLASLYARAGHAVRTGAGRALVPVTALVIAALYIAGQTVSSVRFASTASVSGIRALVATGLAADTVYLIAPDFMAPTFGYYVRDRQDVVYHGFAGWSDPQYVDLRQLRAGWNAPEALAETENRVAALRARRLALVVSKEPGVRADSAGLRLSSVDRLVDDLRRRYALVDVRTFDGRDEPVIVYTFALDRRGSEGVQ